MDVILGHLGCVWAIWVVPRLTIFDAAVLWHTYKVKCVLPRSWVHNSYMCHCLQFSITLFKLQSCAFITYLKDYLFTWIKLYYCYNLFHVTRTIIRQLNWNLICFQLVWEIKTNWTIQTTLGLIKYEGQNWGEKIEGKNWGEKNWLYAPSIMSWRVVWLGFDHCQCALYVHVNLYQWFSILRFSYRWVRAP